LARGGISIIVAVSISAPELTQLLFQWIQKIKPGPDFVDLYLQSPYGKVSQFIL
jgi:hypothetical protein